MLKLKGGQRRRRCQGKKAELSLVELLGGCLYIFHNTNEKHTKNNTNIFCIIIKMGKQYVARLPKLSPWVQ